MVAVVLVVVAVWTYEVRPVVVLVAKVVKAYRQNSLDIRGETSSGAGGEREREGWARGMTAFSVAWPRKLASKNQQMQPPLLHMYTYHLSASLEDV